MKEAQLICYYFLLSLISTFFVILGIVLFFICRRKPVSEKTFIPEAAEEETPSAARPSASAYSLTTIYTATDNFNHRRIIGEGRLGTVYSAVFPTGDLVAVKRIHPRLVLSNAGLGFSSIIKTLASARNPNIVPILGFSQAPGERIIVMEFSGMVSLDYYLHEDNEGASLLDWNRRLRIAAAVARGLEYLHEKMAPNVVHGCVKGSNILLDDNFSARLCDYGLSFLAPNNEIKRGILGYVDDEYWKIGASKESDVYGYGVVLVEILSGRRSNEERLLVKWAFPLIKEMRFNELLDPRVVIPSDIKPLVRLGKVALACVGNSRKSRPSMAQVAKILNNLESNQLVSP